MVKITLKDYLEEKNIPIRWIYEVTGIRYATIWTYVHNKSGSIKLKHLGKIMDALNISDPSLILEMDKNE